MLVRLSILTLFACAASPSVAVSAPSSRDLDITFDVEVGEPLMMAGKEQTAYIKITLGGFALPAASRTPVNLAIVLDRSGSMSGDKIEKAKAAAMMVVDRMQPDDILSVIAFDDRVNVLQPAERVSSRDAIRERISALQPGGSTALFAGLTFGLEEIGKNRDPKRVNRIILLSDGQANVGPSSPNELGQLGEVAGRQGIAITTVGLGLGYNEDLMTQIAMRSDGNHSFAETGNDLARIFNGELGDVLSVVAQDVEVEIEFDTGIVPVRALGREATINGRKATLSLSQLYAKQQKYVLFEVKVPPGNAGKKRALADVAVNYSDLINKSKGSKKSSIGVEFASAKLAVAKKQNKQVLEAAVEAIAADQSRQAVSLRDQGKVKEAKEVLVDNARYLQENAARLKSQRLQGYSKQNEVDATNLDDTRWNQTRKGMKAMDHQITNQQSYR
ncbi:MAG TPA: VWA domain-containing protein [Kofleriaceae bacterium]